MSSQSCSDEADRFARTVRTGVPTFDLSVFSELYRPVTVN